MPEDKRHVGAKAHRAAVSALVMAHKDEFEKMLGDEREKMGLPRVSGPVKKPSKTEMLREQLRGAGIEPKV